MFKIFCVILLIVLETQFYFKMRQAKYDIIRKTAITVIMILIALVVAGIYSLSMFMLR